VDYTEDPDPGQRERMQLRIAIIGAATGIVGAITGIIALVVTLTRS